jgi:hypothetical protein
MFSGTAQFLIRSVSFFVSSVCLLVRVNMVNKKDLYTSMNARVAYILFILEGWVP